MRMDDIGFNHKHDKSFIVDRPNGTEDWLMLIVRTRAVFREGCNDISCSPGAFIIYTPGSPQYYHADNTEYADDWIHFWPDPDEEELLKALNIPLNRITPLPDISSVTGIVRDMCHEHYSANPYRRESVTLCFRLLLYKLSECLMNRSTVSPSEVLYHDKLQWLRDCIYRWPSRDWNVDDMAAEISLSRSRLQHLYSAAFRTSISRDVITSRMDKAAELLRDPDMPIHQIASTVGCSTPSYFNRQFRAAFGKTPTQFRNEYLSAQKK
ncbi:MAG: helix-turn-helix transcriptional regulator [Ruminococcus sp.]|nr:helix-turn-helix transcriptional regulator [Ruminococcus sp.]